MNVSKIYILLIKKVVNSGNNGICSGSKIITSKISYKSSKCHITSKMSYYKSTKIEHI